MPRVYLADKDTLDSVNNKVGTGEDAAASAPTTLFAGIKSLISTLADHVTNWTAARAAKIDKLDNLGTTGDTGGSAAAGTVMAKLNALIGYVITNNTANKTGVLSAKLAYIISLLENATYGLSAIKSSGNWYAAYGTSVTLYTLSSPVTGSDNEAMSAIFVAPANGTYRVDANATFAGTGYTVYMAISDADMDTTAYMGNNITKGLRRIGIYAAQSTINSTQAVYLQQGKRYKIGFEGRSGYKETVTLNTLTVKYAKTSI